MTNTEIPLQKHIPYCIITATPDEMSDILPIIREEFPDKPEKSRPGIFVKIINTDAGSHSITLLLTQTTGMGNIHAAIKTAQVISEYQPSLILFVGTAASMRPEKLHVGDVVIPRAAHLHIYDKIVEEGQDEYRICEGDANFEEFFLGKNALLHSTSAQNLDELCAPLIACIDGSASLETGRSDETAVAAPQTSRIPKIERDSEIITCGMVVNSKKFKDLIFDRAGRKAYAIDMESFGFFQAIADLKGRPTNEDANPVIGIMVRGISDYAADKELTENQPAGWKRIATRNAGRIACQLIKLHASI